MGRDLGKRPFGRDPTMEKDRGMGRDSEEEIIMLKDPHGERPCGERPICLDTPMRRPPPPP